MTHASPKTYNIVLLPGDGVGPEVTRAARDVLSVADNLERGLAAIPAELRGDDKFKGLVTGLEATGRELEKVFERNGITRIAAMGEPLDPNKHQAMMEMPRRPSPPTERPMTAPPL